MQQKNEALRVLRELKSFSLSIYRGFTRMDFFQFSKIARGFDYTQGYTYLKEPIEKILEGKNVCIAKGAQVGATEAALTLTVFLLLQGFSILYMLPSQAAVSQFSAARFNRILEENQDLASRFSFQNVHHKRAGKANLYLRGGNSLSMLREIPVDILILDEVDAIDREAVEYAYERLSGSARQQVISLSTPTLPERGIWSLYQKLSMARFFIECPSCSYPQALSQVNLRQDLTCVSCGCQISHEEKVSAIAKGQWVHEHPDRQPGYHIPQIYSPVMTCAKIAEKQASIQNDCEKQVFVNMKLGLPYSADGARLGAEVIQGSIRDLAPSGVRVAGIDVSIGSLHYVVIASVEDAGLLVLDAFRASWEELESRLRQWHVDCAIIDAMPERSKSREVCRSMNAFAALYPSGLKHLFEVSEDIVKIARTEAIDTVFSDFRNDGIALTKTFSLSPQYSHFETHCTNVVRQYREVRGTVEAFYSEVGDDHYLHALVYAWIAAKISCPVVETEVVGSFIHA